ncbi:phage tail spike protein [Alkalihalobacillus trypoxylicola]|uniref:Peptidase S74 domain-containing protein n=1 Tax=Alkalihalobacillus trypoxylicola TaxID=519424 RepID=A0A162F6M1_9BACI|nr:phage tail spike protein [Alkalihalobacillus trypoxylicola]KYG34905.1 hypothetical protein AZF04_00810 [Alkalihalobacillus trypoxylicola]
MAEIYILNKDDKLLATITEETGLTSTKVRDELNQIASEPFVFTVDANTEEAVHVVEDNQVVFRDKDGDLRLYVIKEIDDINNINGVETTAICLPAFVVELSNHTVVDRRFNNQQAQTALNASLQGTRWSGIVEGSFGTASTNFYYISSLNALWNVRNTWGGDIKDVVLFDAQNIITTRQVKLMQRLGVDRGKRFEIDHDIEEIQRVVLSYPYTALYGRGASLPTEDEEGKEIGGYTRYIGFGDVEWKVSNGDPVDKPLGQLWVGNPGALEKYGYLQDGERIHLDTTWENGDIENPEELLMATWQELQSLSEPEINYKLSVQLLEHIAGYEHEKVSLGDTVRAFDREFARPIEVQARVIAIEYDLLDIEGTAIVEIGQFLSVEQPDDRIGRLEEEIQKIGNRPQKVGEGSFPDIKPGTPSQVVAKSGMKVIQLYWAFDSAIYIKHYEVYGSQVENFIPQPEHLLWRGMVSAYSHAVNTDERWYYRIRAVNHQGTTSEFSQQVSATTARILTEDILFGPELAEKMRELHEEADIIGKDGINFENIRQEVLDQIQADAKVYTDQEIQHTENALMQELADRARLEYVDGKFGNVEESIDLISTSIEEFEGRFEAKADRTVVEAIDGKVTNVSNQVTNLVLGFDEFSVTVSDLRSEFDSIERYHAVAVRYNNSGFANYRKHSGLYKTNGETLWGNSQSQDRSYTLSIYNRDSKRWESHTRYDIYSDQINARYLAEALNELTQDKIFVLVGAHAPARNRHLEGLPDAIYKNGGSKELFIDADWTGSHPTYVLIAYGGIGEGNGNEYFSPADVGWLDVQFTIDNGNLSFGNRTNNYSSRIYSAETAIVQNATSINLRAQEIEVVGNRMTKAEGELSVQSDRINARVERDGIVSALNITPEQVKIDTRLLSIGNFSNLIQNADFSQGLSGHFVDRGTWRTLTSTTSRVEGAQFLEHQAVSNQPEGRMGLGGNHLIEVTEGEQYYFSIWYRAVGAGPFNQVRLELRYLDANRNFVNFGGGTVNTGVTAWRLTESKTTIPPRARYMCLFLRVMDNGNNPRYYFQDPVLRRMSDTNVFVDGAITANHMSANSITAGNGAIANAAITSLNLQQGIIQNVHIEQSTITGAKIADATIDDAKIANLSAVKITTGTLIGIDVQGARFYSANHTDFMEIIGGNARFQRSNGQRVEINPDGLYGYNANGSLRFQADSSLITSAALGTSNLNIYLAAGDSDTRGEVRAVRRDTIPGGGSASDYSYINVRARGFKSPPNSSAYIGTDNEVRITSEGLAGGVYRNLRASGILADSLQVNTSAILYLRTDQRVRIMGTGSSSNYTDLQVNEILAHSIRSNSETSGSNFYVGTGGTGSSELRVTTNGLWGGSHESTTYTSVRASGYYGNTFDQHSGVGGSHIYIRPTGTTGEVRITRTGTTGTYQAIRASAFQPPSSTRETKRDIELYQTNTLDVFRNSDVYTYNYKWEESEAKARLGLMLDEVPGIIHAQTGDTLDFYSMASHIWKGVKDLTEVLDNHEDRFDIFDLRMQLTDQRVKKLEEEVKQLREMIE